MSNNSTFFVSALHFGLTGYIDFAADEFACMLVTEDYVPDSNDAKRSDVIGEVIGEGYTEGGAPASVKCSLQGGYISVSLGAVEWAKATLTARGAVYYKNRGGEAVDDEIIAYVDFGQNLVSSGGAGLEIEASTLRIQL